MLYTYAVDLEATYVPGPGDPENLIYTRKSTVVKVCKLQARQLGAADMHASSRLIGLR